MKPQIYILKNTHLEVHISTLGATLTRMLTKDLQGKVVDVLLGLNLLSVLAPWLQPSQCE